MDKANSILKAKTLTHHKAVEKAPLLRRLMADNLSISEYSTILSRWQQWFSVNESHMVFMLEDLMPTDMEARLKLRRIKENLEHDMIQSCRVSSNNHMPAIETTQLVNKYEALGALYVIEGSTLGGQIIVKRLKSRLDQRVSHSFYEGYGEQNQSMWSKFILHLNTSLSHTEAVNDAVSGAIKTFVSIENSFQ